MSTTPRPAAPPSTAEVPAKKARIGSPVPNDGSKPAAAAVKPAAVPGAKPAPPANLKTTGLPPANLKTTGLIPDPPAPRAYSREVTDANDHLLLTKPDLWLNGILPFLGPGHFILVGGTCQQLRELYQTYVSKLDPEKDLPMVKERARGRYRRKLYERRRAGASDTFYGIVFSNLGCAKYWNRITKVGKDRMESYIVCEISARIGCLEVYRWAHQSGFPLCGMRAAAQNGHVEIVQYAHETGSLYLEDTCLQAAKHGHVKVLQYAHKNGCSWDEDTCNTAAMYGHMDCLQYAHKNGCPWSKHTCDLAAQGGHLEILKYAHDNGCPWDETTCSEAAHYGHMECLRYAHENGCPWDEATTCLALASGHMEILEWAKAKGCPWSEENCAQAVAFAQMLQENGFCNATRNSNS